LLVLIEITLPSWGMKIRLPLPGLNLSQLWRRGFG